MDGAVPQRPSARGLSPSDAADLGKGRPPTPGRAADSRARRESLPKVTLATLAGSAPALVNSAIQRPNAMTKISDIMTRSVAVVQRDETLQAAATRMKQMDIGALPVVDGKALVGMVTDRDITVRGVAAGMIPQESVVSDVMTEEVRWCRADDSVEQVLEQMGDEQVRRLAVLDAGNEIVGIVALGDLATRQSADVDETLREISTPTGS
ncbi:MAG TPA: CBS domain-containing protein [Caldimonas sp.]|nr:CBS domain-containing protein [Caldimonas sp.]HEX2540675.1 CBS domain-containing protein [Caldimonas sp.]